MAKKSKSISFKNATISYTDMTITEFLREEIKTYSIKKLLSDWDNIEGVSLTVKLDEDAPQDGEE